MKRLHGRLFFLILAVLFLSSAAYADSIVSLVFNPSTQSVEQGGRLTFNGTLSVIGDPNLIFVNGDSIATSAGFGFVGLNAADSTLLMLDDLSFLLNAPFTISSDDANGPSSSTFDFFTVAIGSLVTPGTYFGTFSVLGGLDPSAQDILASASFQLNVAASTVTPAQLPEPSSLVLLFTGILGVGARHRFRLIR